MATIHLTTMEYSLREAISQLYMDWFSRWQWAVAALKQTAPQLPDLLTTLDGNHEISVCFQKSHYEAFGQVFREAGTHHSPQSSDGQVLAETPLRTLQEKDPGPGLSSFEGKEQQMRDGKQFPCR